MNHLIKICSISFSLFLFFQNTTISAQPTDNAIGVQ
jgi:hypothetical protein